MSLHHLHIEEWLVLATTIVVGNIINGSPWMPVWRTDPSFEIERRMAVFFDIKASQSFG